MLNPVVGAILSPKTRLRHGANMILTPGNGEDQKKRNGTMFEKSSKKRKQMNETQL